MLYVAGCKSFCGHGCAAADSSKIDSVTDIASNGRKTWPIAPTVLGCLLFLVSGAFAAMFIIYRRRDMGDLQRRLLQRVLFLPFDGVRFAC